MKTNTDQLLIFKTDIGEICSNCEVHKALDAHSEIQQWSLDHEDADCVLRIVSETLTPAMVIGMISGFGHQCQELL